MVVKMSVMVFVGCDTGLNPEAGDDTFLQNIGIHL
jgi:hypothetical protein